MSPTVPLSIAFQALLDQQQAAFSELIYMQVRAMFEEDFCERQEKLWKQFNRAYEIGLMHGAERANRKIEHASDN